MTDKPRDAWSEFAERGRGRPDNIEATTRMPSVPITDPAQPPGIGGLVAGPPRPALIGRFTVGLAGLLAAGCVLLGLALVALMFLAPKTGGTGIDAATGPGWTRTGWHLAVGAASEVVLASVYRRAWAVRVAAAVLVSVGVLAVLALSWWR